MENELLSVADESDSDPEDEPLPRHDGKSESLDPFPLRDSQGPYRLAWGWS